MESGIPKPTDQVPNINAYASNGKIMLCSGIILFTAIVCIFCFHSYVRRIFNLLPRSPNDSSSANVAAQGLDPSILKALPILAYTSKTMGSGLECAVCLSEFQDGDIGRVLPKCKHTFHICCIDMWFRSHSNCPLCRAPVSYYNVSEICAETAVPVTETAGLQAELRHKKEDESCFSGSSSPASLSPLQCQRISSDLLGILVEVPASRGEQRLTGLVNMGLSPSGQIWPKWFCERPPS